MGFIAIDKYSRKILGYLIRNGENITYCCGECDIECASAKDLEEHMTAHCPTKNVSKTMKTIHDVDDNIENEVPPTVLSDLEKEKQLQIKYQVQIALLRKTNFHAHLVGSFFRKFIENTTLVGSLIWDDFNSFNFSTYYVCV